MRRASGSGARQASESVAARLGRLHGLPQKMGQVLAMGGGQETAGGMQSLWASADPMPMDQFKGLLSEAWGRPWQEVLRSLDPTPLAASIGQVHWAQLAGGDHVAVKVRYPGIEAAVASDLRSLECLALPFGGFGRGFDIESYRRALGDQLKEELDYGLEARHQTLMAKACDPAQVVIPAVHQDLCSRTVLVSTWESGASLHRAKSFDEPARERIAGALLGQFLGLCFRHGLVHADPHPGNYAFRDDPSVPPVVLYDYGCVHHLGQRDRMALLRLIRCAAQPQRGEDPFPWWVELGFRADLLEPLHDRLPALTAILFEPFSARDSYDLAGWNRAERLESLLGEDRMNFRLAGPASHLTLLRGLEGLFANLRQLGAPVRALPILGDLFRDFDHELEALDSSRVKGPRPSVSAQAQALQIRITDDGKPVVRLRLPVHTIDSLDEIIDPDLMARIAAEGCSLEEVVRTARQNGYRPGPLFDLEKGGRIIRVSLV